jgi:hypothetical protein
MQEKDDADLTIARLSFFDLLSERALSSSNPFGGVIHISLLSISTLGTISSANGIHTWSRDEVES